MNKTLKAEEKPWRIPTKQEYEELGKTINEISRNKKGEESLLEAGKYVISLGFAPNEVYWSSTQDYRDYLVAWALYTVNGSVDTVPTDSWSYVKCVR